MSRASALVLLLTATLTCSLLAACGSGGDAPVAPAVPKTLAVSLDRSTLTIIAGRRDSLTATVTKTGAITTDITYAVDGLPAGISGTATPRATSGSTITAVVTIDVATSVAPGSYAVTVRSTTLGVTEASASATIVVQPVPAVTLTLDPTSLAINQGASATATLTLVRTNFTGPVTLSALNVVTGVTASFDSATISGTRATMTLAVGGTVALGPTTLNVQAGGSGITAVSAPLALTVNPAPAYTLTVAPTTLAIDQGSSGSSAITLTRTNFTGAVALAVSGLPTGVTGTVTPASLTGTSATLQLNATASTTPGNYTATIRGTSTLADRTASVAFTIAPLFRGTVDFGGCLAADKAVWFAMQDGDTGAWTRVTGTGDTYALSFKDTRVAYAYATAGSATNGVTVRYHTRAEVSGQVLRPCTPTVAGSLTINGTLANSTLSAALFFGGGVAGLTANQPTLQNGPFSISNVRPGRHDFLAYNNASRGLIIRDLDLPNGGSVGTIDFGASNPNRFTLTLRTASASNTLPGETYAFFERYFTTTADYACEEIPLNTISGSGSQFAVYGVPAPFQLPTDYYQIAMQAVAATGTRQVTESFQNFTARVANPFALPGALPRPTVTSIAGSSMLRLASALTSVPSEYDGLVRLIVTDAGVTRRITLVATPAWRGSAGVTFTTPDLTGVAGWSSSWTPLDGAPYNWTLEASNQAPGVCTEGARVVTATQKGGTAAGLRR